MDVTFSAASSPDASDALGVPVSGALDVVGPDPGVHLDRGFLEAAGFRGEVGQTQAFPDGDRHVIAVGVGDAATCGRDDLRRAAAALRRAAGQVKFLATTLHHAGEAPGAAQAVVEGIGLAGYSYRRASGARRPALSEVRLLGAEASEVRRGEVMVAATLRARDWVNRPAGSLTPRIMAEEAATAAAGAGLAVETWDEARIDEEGMGLLAGVAAGSAEPPRLLRVSYLPPEPAAHLAFVGKGITFDSGGLAIKPLSSMQTMKSDMGGAAAVLSAILAIGELKPPVRVDAWAALAENMPGGRATRPGDVHTARDGTTVEVVNTDAEGRLVLADAILTAAGVPSRLAAAGSGQPVPLDAVVDVATLTGGQRVALGPQVAAVLGTDEVVERVLAAAEAAGEPAWRLPLWPGYRSRLDSDVADVRNVAADPAASTITAALFLQRFVGGRPWAHLDIAAPSRVDKDDGWLTRGATGWGTRTLVELACAWS